MSETLPQKKPSTPRGPAVRLPRTSQRQHIANCDADGLHHPQRDVASTSCGHDLRCFHDRRRISLVSPGTC